MHRTRLARMLRAGLLALPLLFPPLLADTGGFACRAGETFGDAQAVVLRVPDGDTLVVDIPGYPPVAGRAISVRIAGCDTPEKRDTRAELRELSRRARELTLHMAAPGSTVTLRNLRRDKYFRLLADVEADGGDIATALIERGLAKPYEGGRKEW
ncbi:MAG TPA: thermonuclease family protein [Nitratidesulfovibrio sp.]|nr:thermonuclease family protein [Nitratidesulfovibrio sp.]